jgi:hypothetical protein
MSVPRELRPPDPKRVHHREILGKVDVAGESRIAHHAEARARRRASLAWRRNASPSMVVELTTWLLVRGSVAAADIPSGFS